MRHLVSVASTGEKTSHWVVKSPVKGETIEWDAIITDERSNELIAWKTQGKTPAPHAGCIEFKPAPAGRGTEVKVAMTYNSPIGKLGVAAARLSGEEPGQQIEDDLRRFKAYMETGEIASTGGQPKGERIRRTK